jgi:hypothetical protein
MCCGGAIECWRPASEITGRSHEVNRSLAHPDSDNGQHGHNDQRDRRRYIPLGLLGHVATLLVTVVSRFGIESATNQPIRTREVSHGELVWTVFNTRGVAETHAPRQVAVVRI